MELRKQPWDNSNNFLRGHVSPLISRTRMGITVFCSLFGIVIIYWFGSVDIVGGVGCKREEILSTFLQILLLLLFSRDSMTSLMPQNALAHYQDKVKTTKSI